MALVPSPRLQVWRRVFLAGLAVWCALLIWEANRSMELLQKESPLRAPFGVFTRPNGATYAQDFSYNMLYFEGIEEHLVAHPYRMADQEEMMRRLLPQGATGMTHAYSPVAFVLAQPLLRWSGERRYLIYTLLGGVGIVLLFGFVLLPGAETAGQFAALAGCAASVCLVLNFRLGQSALITTSLLGALWALLRGRGVGGEVRLAVDVLLALLFWALCLKPSVAIVPAMLLLGARAGRALALAGVLLLATWSCTASYYGGWWTGLTDYSHLLNHYNGAEMTSFMQRPGAEAPQSFFGVMPGRFSTQLFALDRVLILAVSGGLVLLRWAKRISAREHFVGMIAAFLLVSPYLLPSEDWILCLLVVESSFFRVEMRGVFWVKILVLVGIMDWRGGVTVPVEVNFPLRVVLFGWMAVEAWGRERRT